MKNMCMLKTLLYFFRYDFFKKYYNIILVYWTILYRLSGKRRHRSYWLLSYGALKIFGQNDKFSLPGHFRSHWMDLQKLF